MTSRRLGLRFLVAMLSVFALVAVLAPGAGARSDARDKPVLMLHGYDPWGTPTSSCDMWNPMQSTLSGLGFSGPFTSVGYYGNQVSCDLDVIPYGSPNVHHAPGGGVHDRYVNIEHLGYEFAWAVFENYSRHGQPVDIVAHSMGGLVVRYALAQVDRGHGEFPPYLHVEDVVTMGTPHGGSGLANWCWTTQCGDMSSGSSFLSWLSSYGPNPQVGAGTDWTAMGSYEDGIVSESSATNMAAAHKVLYLSSAGIGHGDYYSSTSLARTADVHYQDHGGYWYAWYDGLWPVNWTNQALFLGSW